MEKRILVLKQLLNKIEETLNLYFVKQIPFHLPNKFKEFLVKFGPWLILIQMVVSLLIFIPLVTYIFFTGKWSSGGDPAGLGNIFGSVLVIAIIINIIRIGVLLTIFVLQVMALSGLFRRVKKGWDLLFYSSLISAVYSLLTFDFGALFGALIFFYLLFQVREFYH
jgi:hypothetical protein